jgi:outer membrane protein OmpA-like peptidoglycan-associated protein
MRFGTPERARRPTREWLAAGLAWVLGALIAAGPTWAQDKPTLKDVLGRVQSESETKAVEDLVEKLKGASRKPAPQPAPADTGMPAPAEQPPAGAPPQVASPATPAPAEAKPALAPDEAIKRAETRQAPSVDLEILFDYKSAEVTAKSAALLDMLGRALSDARLAEDAFLIAGHTDAKGGAAYNLELSQRRAEAVRQFLISKYKIDPGKLVAKGYGLQRLKIPADPFAAANRRVQIVNLSKDQR